MKLSEHFYLSEFILSQTAARLGIPNDPDPVSLENLKRTAEGLEKIRTFLGHPIHISSGFRSKALNHVVGGAATSQHMRGEAADFTSPEYGLPNKIAHALEPKIKLLGIDQIILEFGGWVHVSFAANPRHQALTIHSSAEGYLPGIVG